jgi:hypothetical protein
MEQRSTRELLADWLDGNLAPGESDELLEVLQSRGELLDDAARLKAFDRLLHLVVLDAGPDAFVEEVAARCGITPQSRDMESAVRRKLRSRRWFPWALAASVLLLAAFAAWWQTRPFAVVARLQSIRWSDGQTPLRPGQELRAGALRLEGGFVELRFRDGARLIVEGPANLDLRSKSLVRLHSGSAFAHVPKTAVGFTVMGPTGRIIDRGTDFGVHVGAKGMEVHVLKGWVDAGQGSSLQPVRENEALSISADEVTSIPADRVRFLTSLPPNVSREIGWIHWALDENEGVLTEAQSSANIPAEAPARLSSLDDAPGGPTWTTGQFGAALSFDGVDDFVQTDFAGIGGSAARTVAFWVKVPRSFEPKHGYAMVCWGSTDDLTEGWQVSVNPKEDQGPMGRLRVARIGGPIIGSTDLRDDRWHHVAIVFYGDQHRDETTQVLMYVDGELELTTRKGMINVKTDTFSQTAKKVAFGLNIAPVNPNPQKPSTWRVFRGCLDEIFICDAALSQEQIRELMSRNHTSAFASASGF